jgi:hypothetical protein
LIFEPVGACLAADDVLQRGHLDDDVADPTILRAAY